MNNSIISSPLVSVYITTYNRLHLLQRALLSVQNQSYTNLEIIIIDDCSTDGTDDFVSHEKVNDNRIVYIRNEKNNGACFSRNLAIRIAKGEFITGLDDDDEFTLNRIQDFFYYYDDSKPVLFSSYKVCNKYFTHKKKQNKKKITYQDILLFNYIGNQVFCKTRALQDCSGFDPMFPSQQDYDTWIRLLKNQRIAYQVNNYSYIVHKEHENIRISDGRKTARGRILILNKHRMDMNKQQYRYQWFYLIKSRRTPSILDLFRLVPVRRYFYELKLLIWWQIKILLKK